MYYIYMHKNKINGKVYIGQTCQKPEYRWNNGEGYKESPYFYQAIKKYGWDSFEHIILFEGLTANEANQKEIDLIKEYNTMDENFGYNCQAGGQSRVINDATREKNKQHAVKMWQNPEHKLRMSQIMKEKWKDPKYRQKQEEHRKNHPHTISEEGKKKISEARKAYIAKHGTPTQGIGHTEETKEKLRLSKLGDKNPMYGKKHTEEEIQNLREKSSHPIMCVETQQIFSSHKEAAAWCGLSSAASISDYLAGRKKSAGKHPETGEKLHWKKIDKK